MTGVQTCALPIYEEGPELLGHIPVVPVSARKRTGLDVLMHAVKHHYEEGPAGNVVVYRPDMEKRIVEVEKLLKSRYPQIKNIRWHAIKLLERDDEVEKQYSLDTAAVIDRSYEKDIINQKYDYIEEVIDECLFYKSEKAASTDKIDEVLTHRLWGVPIFLGIMALVCGKIGRAHV